MTLEKQADGTFLLINEKASPTGLSTAEKTAPIRTKIAVLTAAEVAQIVADCGGGGDVAKVTAMRDGLMTRVDELTLQNQQLADENGKLKATLDELARPESETPAEPAKKGKK